MKTLRRLAACVAAAALCLCFTGADAAAYTVAGLFGITYDEAVFTLDDTSYRSGGTDSYRWLFMLYNDECLIDVGMENVESYAGLSLLSATAEQRQAYLDDMLDSFSDDSATYLETVEVGKQGVPFYLFQMEDEEGPYLMAETVANGYAIDFFAYYENAVRSADEELMALLTELLATFTPEA